MMNSILLYPVINHDGIGRYCNKLIEHLNINYKFSKYKYMSPLQFFEKIDINYKVAHCPHILVNLDLVRSKKKIIVTIHDVAPIILKNLNYLKNEYYIKRLKYSIDNSDFLIFDSDSAYNDFNNYYYTNKPYKIIKLASDISCNELIEYNRKDFIHVGRRSNHKNIIDAIKAFALISHRIKDNFILVGPDNINDKIINKLIANLKLKDRIFILNNVNDIELNKLYQSSKCLFFPSLYEGYGLPVIEAISNKCPVLVSNISVFKEITNNNAHFINPNSYIQMSELLYKISTDKNFANLYVLNAFNYIKKRTWMNVSEETNEVYKNFL